MSGAEIGAWYVVHTQANSEAKAERNLACQGYEVYLPRFLKRRSHARKTERVASPLFPRYLFVRIDLKTQRWRSIHSTFGVSHLIGNGLFPIAVPNQVLNVIRAREDESGLVVIDRTPKFLLGEKVRVLAGAFADNLGMFDGTRDRDRVAILLDLLGRQVRVSIDAELLAAG